MVIFIRIGENLPGNKTSIAKTAVTDEQERCPEKEQEPLVPAVLL